MRVRCGLSKKELAERCNLQPAAVRRLFAGQSNPTVSTLKLLAEAVGCRLKLAPNTEQTQLPGLTDMGLKAAADFASKGFASISTVLADPPWRFQNRTGKVAPAHRRLSRYDTLTVDEICNLPIQDALADTAHLYLWVPNALLADGLKVLASWGFQYKANLVWAKRRKDGGPDGRGVGFYFRNVTELILFGVRGNLRTLPPARRQVNMIETRKREHSRKPDELYELIESCCPGPYLEVFARYPQDGWLCWGDESSNDVLPRGRSHAMYRGGELVLPWKNKSKTSKQTPLFSS